MTNPNEIDYLAIEIRMISEKLGIDLQELSRRFRDAEKSRDEFRKHFGTSR